MSTDREQELTTGSFVFLKVENQSQEDVVLPLDFGLKLLTYSERDAIWVEIANNMYYMSAMGNNRSLAPHGVFVPEMNNVYTAEVIILPSMPEAKESFVVRVVVQGEVYQNGKSTGEKAGAYVDVTLQP